MAGTHEYLHEKLVQSHCRIDVVTASRLRGVGRVGGAHLLDAEQDGVRRAGAEHQRTYYFAVLVSESSAPSHSLPSTTGLM